jgi:hypothetical protein
MGGAADTHSPRLCLLASGLLPGAMRSATLGCGVLVLVAGLVRVLRVFL